MHTFYQQGGYVLSLLALKQQQDLHWQLDLKLREQILYKIVVSNEKNSVTHKTHTYYNQQYQLIEDYNTKEFLWVKLL